MSLRRLLFASIHCCLDHSSGAALATRDLLEMLAAGGIDCRVLAGGLLDFDTPTRIDDLLASLDLPFQRAAAPLPGGGHAEVLDLESFGVRSTLVPTASSRFDQAPTPYEAAVWLELATRALERFRPEILLTYGGHPASLELIRRARGAGIPVVFHLHNFAYNDRRLLADASALVVPSEYARRHYAEQVGLAATVLPYPIRRDRILVPDPEPHYLSFVNPQPAKGAAMFARIALELRHRPDIPLLVVEGRAAAAPLAGYGLDLSGLETLHRMANTPDPRHFLRVSRVILMPSLWRESFGRVAAEALANGIPVLASDRGALPETLGRAGTCLALPSRCSPDGREVPTAAEVAPWVAAVLRLWDEPDFARDQQEKARNEAGRWDEGKLIDIYRNFFDRVLAGRYYPRDPT